jgi:hypothetical protein
MNKTVIVVVSILSVMCVVALLIWCIFNRYSSTQIPTKGMFVVDKMTGKSWALTYNEMIELKEQKIQEDIQIPRDRLSELRGTASIDSFGNREYFSVKLYNETNWAIRIVTIQISVKENDGKVRWVRDFQKSVEIEPYSVATFDIDLIDSKNIKEFSWNVIYAKGHLTHNSPSWIIQPEDVVESK